MIAKRFHEQQATTNKQPTTNHNPFNKKFWSLQLNDVFACKQEGRRG
jgi:hypothetical protein